jgi:hypothetical protein
MSEDQIIDKVLQLMDAFPSADYYSIYQDATNRDTDDLEVAKSATKLSKILIHHNLIEGESPYFKLSGAAIVINKNGGWLKHILNETKDAMDRAEEESKEKEKLKLDIQLVRWKRFAFWPLFALGLFGGVYSFIDLIDNQANKEDAIELRQSIEQMELELSKLRTSLSDQKTDTLSHNSSSDKKE